MFIADYTFDLSNNSKRAIVFLQYIQQQEYEKCLNYAGMLCSGTVL